MNQQLQTILDFLQQNKNLSAEEIDVLIKAVKKVDNDLTISEFKLERTEKVKSTTAILLEETIAELEQKRKAVEVQNHELEIEGALERVRSVAMGMKKREDMLDICKTISQQLELLKVKEIRNVQTAIFYEERGTYMNYQYYAKHDKTFITDTVYTDHDVARGFAAQMLKGKGKFYITHIEGREKLDDWIEYQKSTNVFIDEYLYTASSLSYYWYSLGPVALGISTYFPLTETEENLFKRFLNVFELAYRRYLDIEKAEAQAREAQIQLALERIRARTMAMQKSEELSEAVYILFQQFRELGENPDQATIGVINEQEHLIEYWVTMYGNQMNKVFKFSIDEPHVTNKIYNAWKDGKKSLVIDLSGKELSEFMAYRAGKGGAAVNPNEKKRIINVAFFSKGLLNVQSNEQRSDESIKLLERFAVVFEQTYTRFLDLQKAEAQAREAKIEAALERTRTQSMLMQHSKELDDTLRVFHEQVLLLGIHSAFSFLWLPDEEKDRHIFWAAWGENKNGSMVFKSKAINYPLDRNEPATAQCLIDWKSNEPVVSYHVPPAGVESYFAAWQELIAGVEQLKPEYFSDGLYYVEAFMKYGCFGVIVKSEIQEEEKILARFAIEFERAYTRFLDLQKAEAQAREAKIETALEKVRSRTMSMQKSNELGDVATVLFKELNQLVNNLWTCGFVLCEKGRAEDEWWLCAEGGFIPAFYLPNVGDATHANIYGGWLNGETYHTEQLEGEALKEHYDWLMNISITKKIFDDIAAAGYERPTWQKLHCAYFSKGYLCAL